MTPRKGGYNEAAKRATIKYQKEHLEQLNIKFPKGFKANLTSHTELTGEAVAAFVRRAIEETIARDRARMREGFKPEPREE